MQLVLCVGEKLFDVIPIKKELASDTDYMAAMKRLLMVKHELKLLAYLQQPTFYIRAASAMNCA